MELEFRLRSAEQTNDIFPISNQNDDRAEQAQQCAESTKFQPNAKRSKHCSNNNAKRDISRCCDDSDERKAKENTEREIGAEQTRQRDNAA